LNCVESVKVSDLTGVDYEIIVVDNNSGDGIIADVQKRFKDVDFIQSNRNLGMGGGNNLGIEQSRGEYALILNPDTIVKKDSIKKMYEFLENNNDVGIVGPKLIYPDGRLQYSCFKNWKFLTPLYRRTFLGKLNKKHIDNFLMKDYDHKSKKEVNWLMGSCLLIRKNVLNKIGLFDKRFFMYFEDTDLCRRAWQSGYKVVYLPEAVVIHDHGRASAEKPWYLAPFFSKLSRIHIASWIKYFIKWRMIKNKK
ncbi:MAG: glycosyltransferase, partial [Actinobacteria bacterium]|nr:glycosyltransferase [Actinomycetota bacterium]